MTVPGLAEGAGTTTVPGCAGTTTVPGGGGGTTTVPGAGAGTTTVVGEAEGDGELVTPGGRSPGVPLGPIG